MEEKYSQHISQPKKKDGRRNNGGHSTKGFAGRKPKAVEVKLQQRLHPLSKLAFKRLKEGVDKGEFKFIQLFFNYYVGKPKETKEVTFNGEQPLFNLQVFNQPKQLQQPTIDVEADVLNEEE